MVDDAEIGRSKVPLVKITLVQGGWKKRSTPDPISGQTTNGA